MIDGTARLNRVPALDEVLRACAEELLPPDVALMRLILLTEEDGELASFLQAAETTEAGGSSRLRVLLDLAHRHRGTWATVRATAAAVPHGEAPAENGAAEVARLARRFDRAAKISPEASVALYSLGDAERLDAATREIAGWMAGRNLLGGDRTLLDVGCGIGRLERALHGQVAEITGCDISGEMVAAARRRCGNFANVAFHQTSGLDLQPFRDAGFDCVISVDAFPYLVAAGDGLAERHFAESARVLRTGGALAILNYSYQGSLEQACREVRQFGRAAGFTPEELGTRPFRLWDGSAFLLRKT